MGSSAPGQPDRGYFRPRNQNVEQSRGLALAPPGAIIIVVCSRCDFNGVTLVGDDAGVGRAACPRCNLFMESVTAGRITLQQTTIMGVWQCGSLKRLSDKHQIAIVDLPESNVSSSEDASTSDSTSGPST